MPDQVFVDVLGHDMHGTVRCQPWAVTPSHYYDSQGTLRIEFHTIKDMLSDFQAQLQRQEKVTLRLKEMLRNL